MIKEVIPNDREVSETIKWIFENLVPKLKLIPHENFKAAIEYEIENPEQNAVHKLKNHPSKKNDNI